MNEPHVIVSQSYPAQDGRAELETALAENLAERGLDVTLVSDIYHWPETAPLPLNHLDEHTPLIVFSWHQPRALFWMLAKRGLTGRRAETLHGSEGRPVVALDLHERCCAERWAEAVEELLGGEWPTGDGAARRRETELAERWYPVVDYDRCTGCLDCLEFCLFGVYDTDEEGAITVAVPGACKPGCPACSRVCPSQAIMFPLHPSDPAIAGADEGDIRPFDAAQIQQVRERYEQGEASVQDVVDACACRGKGKPAPQEADQAKPKRDGDYFDDIIDGLVQE